MNAELLDYTVEKLHDGEFQVWTPDINGAVIGCGDTARNALMQALSNLRVTANQMELQATGHLPMP